MTEQKKIRLSGVPPWHRVVLARTGEEVYTTEKTGAQLSPDGMEQNFSPLTQVFVHEKASAEMISKLIATRHPWAPNATPHVLEPGERGPYNKPLTMEIERLRKENEELHRRWYRLKLQMDTVADVVSLYKGEAL